VCEYYSCHKLIKKAYQNLFNFFLGGVGGGGRGELWVSTQLINMNYWRYSLVIGYGN